MNIQQQPPHPLDPKRLKAAWREFVVGEKPNLMLKLGSGDGCRVETLLRDARHFFNRIQDQVRGRHWYRYPAEEWPVAFGFVEHVETNLHMHLAVKASDLQLRANLQAGAAEWRKIRPKGDFHADLIEDPVAYISYITKEYRLSDRAANVFVYGRRPD